MKWTDAPWATIDTETTGVDPSTARVWEVGIRFRGGELDGRHTETLVAPGEPIPEQVVEICGLGPEDLDAIAAARPFAEIAPRLLQHLSGRVLVGYNLLSYDLPLLQAELKRCGLPSEQLDDAQVVDVLVLVRELRPMARSRKLADVYVASGLPQLQGVHRVRADVLMTERILLHLSHRLPPELDTLLVLQAGWRAEQEADFERYSYWLRSRDGHIRMGCGKHGGEPLGRVPASYLRYMLNAQQSWDEPLPEAVVAAFREALRR